MPKLRSLLTNPSMRCGYTICTAFAIFSVENRLFSDYPIKKTHLYVDLNQENRNFSDHPIELLSVIELQSIKPKKI